MKQADSAVPAVVVAIVVAVCVFCGMGFAEFGFMSVAHGRNAGWIFVVAGICFMALPSLAVFGIWIAIDRAKRAGLHVDVAPQRGPWIARAEPVAVSRRIRDFGSRGALGEVFFGIVFAAISFAFLMVAQTGGVWLSVPGSFVVIGVVILVRAAARLARARRFESELVLDQAPVAIGGTLCGEVEVRTTDPMSLRSARSVVVTFARVARRSTDSGDFDRTLWQASSEVPAARVRMTQSGVSIPVEFAIPNDGEPSDAVRLNGRIVWVMTVEANSARTHYWSRFEVPVVRATEQSQPLPLVNRLFAVPQVAVAVRHDAAIAPPLAPTIRVRETPQRLELMFPAMRDPSTAFLVVIATASFGGCFVFSLYKFSMVGILGLAPVVGFLAYTMIDLLLFRSTVVVFRNTIQLQRRAIRSSHLSVPRTAVADVRLTMTSASSTADGRDDVRYELSLVTTDGRKTTIGKHLKQHEGEWLAQKLRERLQLTA